MTRDLILSFDSFFFFQAEDGIRDHCVTGVQTCALPILYLTFVLPISSRGPEITITFKTAEGLEAGKTKVKYKDVEVGLVETVELSKDQIGRASCRERV